MENDFIMQMRPLFGEEEALALANYMKEDGFLTEFKNTHIFENMIAEYTGSKHCIVVNNGTISLTLAAMALDIGYGDEVLVPNYTMIATPNSVKLLGAKPVFVDVERETLCLDLDKAKNAVTSKTKAIMLVAANGRFPKRAIESYREFCDIHSLKFIEDAAQGLGSFYPDGRHIGRAGDVGSFSFSAPKIISTGQGGALVTDSDAVASILRKLKDFGRSSGGNDIHDQMGLNFKFTELQAVVGIEQMKKLQKRVERKKAIWRKYKSGLSSIQQVELFDHNLEFTTPWFIDLLVEDRDKLAAYLKDRNIGSRVMYPPINEQKAYNETGSYPVSERVGAKGIWLPSQVQLKDEEIDYICRTMATFYECY